MYRDVEEGSDFADFPRFGWGRIKTCQRVVRERYICLRAFGRFFMIVLCHSFITKPRYYIRGYWMRPERERSYGC